MRRRRPLRSALGRRGRWGRLVVSPVCVALIGGCAGSAAPPVTSSSTQVSAPAAGPGVATTAGPTTAVSSPLLEVRPRRYGDDPDLDRLVDLCRAGSGAACDELYLAAPLGSEYSELGYSCGGRPDVLVCTDLDR